MKRYQILLKGETTGQIITEKDLNEGDKVTIENNDLEEITGVIAEILDVDELM